MKPNNIRIVLAVALTGALITPGHAQLQTAPPLFVAIDATGLTPGALTSIPNNGTLGGFFQARGGGTTIPNVVAVDGGGTVGILFDGGDYLQHVATLGGAVVAAPAGLVGVNPTCTIEAWVLNGAIDREETILAWGKRSGLQTQSHHAFIYGWDAAWGAMAHWDSPTSIGWTSGLDGGGVFSTGVPSAGVWHHLVYTFDGTTQRVYADGVQKNSEVVSLNIASGPPINIAAQTDANGSTVTATLRGSLTIGRLRIHDGALSADQIATNYLLEVSAFTNGSGAQLLSGPAHRYQFDNAAGAATAGSVLLDSAGTANGTVLGTGATFTGSRLTLPGGASGTAAYADLPDGLLSANSTNKGGSGEVTIEGWVKITGNRAWSRMFDFGSSSGGSGQDYLFYGAQVNTDAYTHRLEVKNVDAVGGTGGGGTIDHGSTTFGTNLHFAITWNDATGEMRVYENGEFVIRRTETARLTQLNDVNVWLGRSQFTSDQNLQGEFDEFRIYNRVLSDAELRGNFLRGPNTVSAQLTMFNVTGGGSGCGSVPVGLSGSEIGVTYLLRTNSVYAGVAVDGTGSAINFGNQTASATYSVLASNTTSAVTAVMSGGAIVTIIVPPAITSGPSPANFTNYQGGYLSFLLTATGSPLNFQWKRDGTNLVNGGRISGANSNRLTIYPAGPSDTAGGGHGYVCVVSNSCLTVPSVEATATIIPFVAIPETVAGIWTNRLATTNGGVALWVLPDNEGNIIVTGTDDGAAPAYSRVTAIKYSSSGIPLWTNDNNGALEDQDSDPKAALDGNGNLIVAKGISQIVVDKYSGTNGLLLWEKRISTDGSARIGLAVDTNGNAIVAGKTFYTSYVAKYAAADGSLLWQTNRQNFIDNHFVYLVVLDTIGNAVVAGWGGDTGGVGNDVFITKYAAADGSVMWDKRYGKPYASGSGTEDARSLAIGPSGNVVVSGAINTNNQWDILVAKFASADGALLWETIYNVGPGVTEDQVNASALDVDENVLITATCGSDFYTAKYAAADGSLLWDKRYNGPNNRFDIPTAIAVDGNGDVVVTGPSGLDTDPITGNSTLTADIQTIKYAGENGAQLWSARFNGSANRDDQTVLFCKSVAITPAGEVVVAGSTDGGFVIPVPYPDHWVTIKYSTSAPNTRPAVVNPIPDTNGVYGTPFNFTFATNTFSDTDTGQTLSYSATGLPAGITFTPGTRTFAGTATTVGTNFVTVTATDNGSPALSTNDVFDIVIAKAPLTATADSKSRGYGLANPPLTGSIIGLVNGDNVTVTFATTATVASPPGAYPITPILSDPDGKLGNYAVTTNIGTLTINAVGEFQVEMPPGTNLTSSAAIYFGSMLSRYLEPTSQTQAPDHTFTVNFAGIFQSAYATYTIEWADNPFGPWSQLLAPGLAPDAEGTIQFHDPTPKAVAYYRLRIDTDTHRVFTIRNTGANDLTGIGVGVTGTNAANFELDLNGTATVLSPGASTTFAVTYVAFDTNARSAALSISANVPSPFVLTLIGGDVAPPNARPLVLNPIPDTNGIYGTPFNFTFAANTFSDSDAGQTLTYSASSLPPGITFTPGTRAFSGTPTAVGTASVIVTATDNGSPALSTNDVFDVVIAKAPLTVSASNASRVFGVANPMFSGSLAGVAGGDNITASFNSTATASSPPGDYSIIPELQDPDGKLPNYTVTTNLGTLSVQGVTLEFTLSAGAPSFCWPTNADAFLLEYADNLTAPVTWHPVTTGITTNSASICYDVTPEAAIPTRFYRLFLR